MECWLECCELVKAGVRGMKMVVAVESDATSPCVEQWVLDFGGRCCVANMDIVWLEAFVVCDLLFDDVIQVHEIVDLCGIE